MYVHPPVLTYIDVTGLGVGDPTPSFYAPLYTDLGRTSARTPARPPHENHTHKPDSSPQNVAYIDSVYNLNTHKVYPCR